MQDANQEVRSYLTCPFIPATPEATAHQVARLSAGYLCPCLRPVTKRPEDYFCQIKVVIGM